MLEVALSVNPCIIARRQRLYYAPMTAMRPTPITFEQASAYFSHTSTPCFHP